MRRASTPFFISSSGPARREALGASQLGEAGHPGPRGAPAQGGTPALPAGRRSAAGIRRCHTRRTGITVTALDVHHPKETQGRVVSAVSHDPDSYGFQRRLARRRPAGLTMPPATRTRAATLDRPQRRLASSIDTIV